MLKEPFLLGELPNFTYDWKSERVSIENSQVRLLFTSMSRPSPPWRAVLQMMSGASLDELWQHKCCPQHLGCAETNQKLEVNASLNLGIIDQICVVILTACLWEFVSQFHIPTRRIGENRSDQTSIKKLLKCKKSRCLFLHIFLSQF